MLNTLLPARGGGSPLLNELDACLCACLCVRACRRVPVRTDGGAFCWRGLGREPTKSQLPLSSSRNFDEDAGDEYGGDEDPDVDADEEEPEEVRTSKPMPMHG